MIDSFDLDERRSAGKVLVIPNAPWGSKPPTPVDHYVAPESPPTDQQVSDRALARDIYERAISTIPPELHQRAAAAYAATQQAGRALNAAQREYAALQAPAPAGMSVDDLGARNVRRVALVSYIEDLRRQQEAANQTCAAILDDLHFQAEHHAGRVVIDQERARIREMRDEAERLLHAADHHQIALQSALSQVANWLPTEPTRAPVQAAPIVEPAKRKRLFS